MSDDLFPEQIDDHEPVTRGDVRRIVSTLMQNLEVKVSRAVLKAVLIGVVGNQALSHVELPSTIGFGAAGALGLYALKGLVSGRG